MRKFSDFNIKPSGNQFVGPKIRISKVLNQTIVVHAYEINPSKYQQSNSRNYLKLQISLAGEKHVLFTGSKMLAETIKQIPEDGFPFETKITQEGESFQFN